MLLVTGKSLLPQAAAWKGCHRPRTNLASIVSSSSTEQSSHKSCLLLYDSVLLNTILDIAASRVPSSNLQDWCLLADESILVRRELSLTLLLLDIRHRCLFGVRAQSLVLIHPLNLSHTRSRRRFIFCHFKGLWSGDNGNSRRYKCPPIVHVRSLETSLSNPAFGWSNAGRVSSKRHRMRFLQLN